MKTLLLPFAEINMFYPVSFQGMCHYWTYFLCFFSPWDEKANGGLTSRFQLQSAAICPQLTAQLGAAAPSASARCGADGAPGHPRAKALIAPSAGKTGRFVRACEEDPLNKTDGFGVASKSARHSGFLSC